MLQIQWLTITFGSNGDDGVQVVMNGNVVSQFGKDATRC